MIVVLLLLVIVGAFVWWFISIYFFLTVPQPARGGQYVEAFVGQPRYINPLLSHSSSADRSLVTLIFSSLFDYDENGKLRNDLAERYEVSDDSKEYTVFLRKDVLWHDGEKLTADDVIFTIDVAKDITFGAAGVSNDLRLAWHDIKVEKIDDFTVKFTLPEANSDFLHSLTLGILPKHIWENITPEQFQLSEYNQKPIGAGPFEFVDLDIDAQKDLISTYVLRANENYYRGEPFITKFIAHFYPTRADAVSAYKDGEVLGVVVDKKEYVEALKDLAQKQSISLPHYFAVFLNQTKSVPLAFDEVREALSMAIDRDALVGEVFGGDAQTRYSPFAEGVEGFDSGEQQHGLDINGAKELLEKRGWKVGDDGIRYKGDDKLAFSLDISSSQKEMKQVAELLQKQWKEIGVDMQIKEHDKADLETNIIKPRDFDALLYAHQMRFEPNLLPLWHGKEKEDPGLNYAMFDDKQMNEALEQSLKTNNHEERLKLYKTQQERLKNENPAIFLFAPGLSFMHSDGVKNIRANKVNVSADRYTDVHLWYVKQKRVKK